MGDAGEADAGGDGLDGRATLGKDQIEDAEADWDSNEGDSPIPSSRSIPAPQMATRSFRPGAPLLDDELLQLPLDEKAPLDPLLPLLPVEPGGSRHPRIDPIEPNPPRQSASSRSFSSCMHSGSTPVRWVMCAWISLLAAATLSGRPVTSNTGSLSRLGVTMYVCVWCWMRLIVAPLGPTTRPTTRYGTRTWMVMWPGTEAGGPGGAPRRAPSDDLREARIWEKCSAAERISRLARATSSLRPVTTKTGSSPRTGVLMYVLVLARRALILQPVDRKEEGRG